MIEQLVLNSARQKLVILSILSYTESKYKQKLFLKFPEKRHFWMFKVSAQQQQYVHLFLATSKPSKDPLKLISNQQVFVKNAVK